MAFSPIAFIAPNYSDYGTYWLKAYLPGSTTPKPLAIDLAGTTTFAKLQLNVNGFFKSAGGALITPYVEGAYDAYLFETEAEADANNTASAIRLADNITPLVDEQLRADLAAGTTDIALVEYTFDTVALLAADTRVFPVGTALKTKGYYTIGDSGGAQYIQTAGAAPSIGSPAMAGGGHAKIQIYEGIFYAIQYGVIADSDKTTGGGTDNSSMLIAVNSDAFAAGGVVHYQATGNGNAAIRSSTGWRLGAENRGPNKRVGGIAGTLILFDNATPIDGILTNFGPALADRAAGCHFIHFKSLQNKIHTLFKTNYYRDGIFDCTIQGFNVGADFEGVFIYFHRTIFVGNNIGAYPRPLEQNNKPSTMAYFETCQFLANDIGYLQENRGLAPTFEDNDFLSTEFNSCGFEQNRIGLKVSQRNWYFTTLNCWSEANTEVGVDATKALWVDLNSRWDDTVIYPNRADSGYFAVTNGIVELRAVKSIWKQNVELQSSVSTTLIIKSDGTVVGTQNIPIASVSVQANNTVRINFSDTIRFPSVKVTGIIRNQELTGVHKFENTASASAVADFGTINQLFAGVHGGTYGTYVVPNWWVIEINWVDNFNQ
jgi:3D (Asp-Asp-Asp) domain-containing protein